MESLKQFLRGVIQTNHPRQLVGVVVVAGLVPELEVGMAVAVLVLGAAMLESADLHKAASNKWLLVLVQMGDNP